MQRVWLIIKFVKITVQQMSQTLFKVMAHSYCRYHEQGNLLRDIFNALSSQVQNIDSKLRQQIKQIAEVLSLPSQVTEHEMSVIFQQQTERSLGDHTGYQQWMGQLKDGFNVQIGKLAQMEGSIDKLVQIYKNQLVEISQVTTKWETTNQELKKNIQQLNQQKKLLQEQNNQLKDQITMQAAQMFISQSDQDVESVFDHQPKKQRQNLRGKNSSMELKNTSDKGPFNPQPKIKHIQRNKGLQIPKPTTKIDDSFIKSQNVSKQMKSSIQTKRKQQEQQNQTKLIEVRIHSEKDSQEQLQKWKKLSKKIDQLKSKLVLYEDEIGEKDALIKKLTNELKEYKQQGEIDSEQRRKIKTVNTTLRGQKTVLQNQLNSLRKIIAQKTQLCNVQEIQIQQLKVQVQNFSQTIKWQNSTIDELRSTITKSQNRINEQSKLKIEKLCKINQQLVSALNRQQMQLQHINNATLQIEQLYNAKINILIGKIAQMEMILDEKNDCIIKMKTKSFGNIGGGFGTENINPNIQNQNQAYLNELVRVLTKKVADRDQIIRRLQSSK